MFLFVENGVLLGNKVGNGGLIFRTNPSVVHIIMHFFNKKLPGCKLPHIKLPRGISIGKLTMWILYT
jgi:hypothetical protein